MKSKKRYFAPGTVLSVLVLFCILLSACAQSSSNNGNGTAIPAGPIKIGVALSLTGDNSADGQATQQGYDTWAAYVNNHGGLLGHQVQMVYHDDQTKVAQTKTLYEQLINVDKVNFVLGPFDDPETVTGAEVAHEHGMAFIEGIGTSPSTFSHGLNNLFSVSLSAVGYLKSFVNYILSLPQDMRPKTVAYITSDQPFTVPQIKTARQLLDAPGPSDVPGVQGGLTEVLNYTYPSETQDIGAVAQKVVLSKADVVIIGSIGLADSKAFFNTFIQQKYNPKLVIATAGPDQGDAFVQAVGKTNTDGILVPNDGWFPTIKNYQNADFVNFITSKYHIQPGDISSDSVQAFSVGQVLQQAVEKDGNLSNAQLIKTLSTGLFQSLQGTVAFDGTGQNKLATAFLFQWQKGNLIPVYPASQAQANLEYPKPNWGTTAAG